MTAAPLRLGGRLRHAREARRLSLGDLAARCGMTKSFLSRVERDAANPSVASLVAICEALGLPMATLFSVPEATLVPAAGRPQFADLPRAADVVDTLITPRSERHLTVLETVAAPGGSGGARLYTLASEAETCFVLEGVVEVTVEAEVFRLEAGDALTFGAAVPHTWRNADPDRGARILWILAPAIPDPQGRTTT